MTKPWLDGLSDPCVGSSVDYLRHQASLSHQNGRESDLSDRCAEYLTECARVARFAPALARALAMVEWSAPDHSLGNWRVRCPACEGYTPSEKLDVHYSIHDLGHAPGCPLDAALTAAGLTPEDREEIRNGKDT